MLSRKWILTMVMILVITVFSTGCGLFSTEDQDTSQPIDPPPQNWDEETDLSIDLTEEDIEGTSNPEESAGESQGIFEGELYLYDPQGNIVPLTLGIPKTEGIGKQVLRYMVKGGPVEALLPEGFSAVLPEGTEILGMKIDQGVAIVDFSPQFKNYSVEEEQHIIDAITWALTQFDTIDSVKIWINGYPQEVMPVGGTPITSMSRDNGINLELSHGVDLGNTSKVTLYFLAETEELTYYVPVTRIVQKTDQIAMETLRQLIKGPAQDSNLYSPLLPTTKVLDAKVLDNVVIANFNDVILDYNSGDASPEAVRSIVLSLSENTGVKQVQLQVNGKTNFTAGDLDLSQPMARPATINTF